MTAFFRPFSVLCRRLQSPSMAWQWLLYATLLALVINVAGHGRLMKPVSRASMWREGFDNPADYNDNQGFCGGFTHQWHQMDGKCGICGDPYDANPKEHEAPGGRFANGIIVADYNPGDVIDVTVQVTANHRGSFTFKLCANNNPGQDPTQECFDNTVLKVVPGMTDEYTLPSYMPQMFDLQLQLPDGLECTQCILQWTYNTANSWGTCEDGSGAVGCGPQETFRACSDISIGAGPPVGDPSTTTTEQTNDDNTSTTTTTTTTEATTTTTKDDNGGSNCHAIGVWKNNANMNQWCSQNCNHVPSYCPASHCECT